MLRTMLVFSVITCVSCLEPASQTYRVDVDLNTGQVVYEFPSGYTTTSTEEFQTDLEWTYLDDPYAEADVLLGENIPESTDSDYSYNRYPLQPFKPIRVWNLVLTGGRNDRYVSGCIKRNGPYFAIRLNTKGGKEVFDWHFAIRNSDGWWCLDAYESVRDPPINWCNNPCLPSGAKMREFFESIRSSIMQSALDFGVPYATAAIVATIGAALVVAGTGAIVAAPVAL